MGDSKIVNLTWEIHWCWQYFGKLTILLSPHQPSYIYYIIQKQINEITVCCFGVTSVDCWWKWQKVYVRSKISMCTDISSITL